MTDDRTIRTRRTRRWIGALGVALLATVVGVATGRPLVLLGATVGLAFAVSPHLHATPAPSVSVSRTLSTTSPRPGEAVDVALEVRNEGGRTLPDVRVVDALPERLPVVEGRARVATALRPGESVRVDYVVRATGGPHRIDPASVVVRDWSGRVAVETRAGGSESIEVDVTGGDGRVAPSVAGAGAGTTGEEAGAGQVLHQVREYRRGDPLSRVDWNRFARTGELATVEFREDRSVAALVVVDARPAARRAGPDGLPATAHATAAAAAVIRSIATSGGRVGLATLGGEEWRLPVAAGRTHATRLRRRLADWSPASTARSGHGPGRRVSETEPDPVGERLARVAERAPRDAGLVVVSPLLDDPIATAVEARAAAGRPVDVVSPDVTRDGPLRTRVARLERRHRLRRLRAAGATVVDWTPERALEEGGVESASAGPDDLAVPTATGGVLSVVLAGGAVSLLGGVATAGAATLGWLGVLAGPRLSRHAGRAAGAPVAILGTLLALGAIGTVRPAGGLPALVEASGLVGLAGVGLGVTPLRRGWARPLLATGATVLVCSAVAWGVLVDPAPVAFLGALAATVLAWDVGEQAVSLGEHVGAGTASPRVDALHAGASALAGVAGVGLGLAAGVLTPLALPAVALAALVVGCVALTLALYS